MPGNQDAAETRPAAGSAVPARAVTPGRRLLPDAPTAVQVLCTAVFLTAVRPLTWPATLGVIVGGGLVVHRGLGLSRDERGPVPPAPSRRALMIWWAPLLAFAVLEIIDDALGSTYAHPTLSILLDPVTNAPAGRFLGVLAWMTLGDYLVRR